MTLPTQHVRRPPRRPPLEASVLGLATLVAFAATTDLERAAAFYGGVLGLTIAERSPYAVVVDAAETPLRVTLFDQVASAGYTVLGWLVPDITATVASLRAAGVIMNVYEGMDARGVWTTHRRRSDRLVSRS